MNNISQIIALKQQQNISEYQIKCEFILCYLGGYNKNIELCKKCGSIMCGECIRTDFNRCLNCLELKCHICREKNSTSYYFICQKCNDILCNYCQDHAKIRKNNNNISRIIRNCINCA